ncbi:MAG: DUF805 domain-containing protein [Stappiaceae bacterium]
MTQNPTPAQASLKEMLWLFFGFSGRITREIYWLGFGFCYIISLIVIQPHFRGIETVEDIEKIPAYVLPFMLLFVWCELALVVKRAHDKGLSGFIALLALVPLVNFAFLIFLGLIAGDSGPNKYGRYPNTPPQNKV